MVKRCTETMTPLERACYEMEQAVDFFDRVKRSTESEKIAVGKDHWDWLESAARKVAAEFAKEKS